MRNDGNVVAYVLEARRPGKTTMGEEWFSASFDHFGTPPGFKASDKCWQQTGLRATFDEEQGIRALVLMSREHVEYDWRLMRLEISQHHFEVAQMSAKKPKSKPPETHSYPEDSDYELRRRAVAISKG